MKTINQTQRREIKFRAWDEKYRKMIFTGFHLLGEVMAFGGIEEYLFETQKEKDGLPTIERWNDIIIMQYTGLYDKNGKEIYEGDIIIYEDRKWLVEWSNDRWDMRNGNYYIRYDDEADDPGFTNWNKAEIIGNIYENPELINQNYE